MCQEMGTTSPYPSYALGVMLVTTQCLSIYVLLSVVHLGVMLHEAQGQLQGRFGAPLSSAKCWGKCPADGQSHCPYMLNVGKQQMIMLVSQAVGHLCHC